MAEIFCKRCLHYEDLGRPLRANEACPACGAGVRRRNGKPPRPATHFMTVLKAILSWRGLLFLVAFSLFGMVPIGALAWASIIMLFLGSLKLALKAMNVSGNKIDFPEVSPEELLDKSALVPALAFVFAFVWAPPILLAYGASGVFTLDPGGKDTDAGSFLSLPAPTTTSTTKAKPKIPEMADLPNAMPGIGADGQLDPQVKQALEQAGIPADALKGEMDPKALQKALEDAPAPAPHLREKTKLDVTRVASGLFGLLLFLWAPMAVVLYLRTSSTLAMFFVPAGARTMRNDPGGYFVLCVLVLPALAARFAIDAYTSTTLIAAPPLLFLKGVLVLLSWALCGLYVRQHARAFEMPVDDDDWIPHSADPPAVPVVKGALIR